MVEQWVVSWFVWMVWERVELMVGYWVAMTVEWKEEDEMVVRQEYKLADKRADPMAENWGDFQVEKKVDLQEYPMDIEWVEYWVGLTVVKLADMMAELKDAWKVEGWVAMMAEQWVDRKVDQLVGEKEVEKVYKMVALQAEQLVCY